MFMADLCIDKAESILAQAGGARKHMQRQLHGHPPTP